MSNFLQNVDLSCHSLNIALTLYAVLLKNLDGDLLSTDLVSTYSHFAERTLPERSSYNNTNQSQSTSLGLCNSNC